jgi:hypothetical protein
MKTNKKNLMFGLFQVVVMLVLLTFVSGCKKEDPGPKKELIPGRIFVKAVESLPNAGKSGKKSAEKGEKGANDAHLDKVAETLVGILLDIPTLADSLCEVKKSFGYDVEATHTKIVVKYPDLALLASPSTNESVKDVLANVSTHINSHSLKGIMESYLFFSSQNDKKAMIFEELKGKMFSWSGPTDFVVNHQGIVGNVAIALWLIEDKDVPYSDEDVNYFFNKVKALWNTSPRNVWGIIP